MSNIVSTDPIADMLTRIRNAINVRKREVSMPHSKVKEAVATLAIGDAQRLSVGMVGVCQIINDEDRCHEEKRRRLRRENSRREALLVHSAGNCSELEDREKHRHDDAANHHAEENNQDRLDQ